MSKRKTSEQPRAENGQSLRTLSHALSWALRHGAPELGLEMSPDGFVLLSALLECPHARFNGKWTERDVRAVVETNDKQRFKLETRPVQDGGEALFIRANQGHSIPGIDAHQLLTRISPEELKSLTIVHGTFLDKWEKYIQTQGLSRMGRNHIHFASGLPHDGEVISGMRKSCNVYIYVDGARCAHQGIDFFKSDNGVLLTAGVDDTGILPLAFFSNVTDSSGKILWTNDV
jgi:RNA:NAD 2'-phosphotransferase (TPT1/KptA family)